MNKLGIFMNFWEKTWAADHVKYINKAADIGFEYSRVSGSAAARDERSALLEPEAGGG
jgi:hypothetical protein